jgi:membrane protein DedA with SNARE-associated domain
VDEQPRRRIPVAVLVTPIVALSLVGMVADALGPRLITERPLLQMFLNPRNRYLVLAAPQVDLVPFFAVGFLRLVLTDPLGYLLGRQHGDAALRWAEDKLGDEAGWIRRVERWFRRAAPLVILVMPNLYMCILAGATGMKAKVFFSLNIAGTLGRLVLIWIAGETFESELGTVLGFIQRYQWWLVGLSIVVVSLQARQRKEQGVLESPQQIEEEIEALEEDPNL